MNDQLILVDENDNPLGTMEKLAVHQQGLLHRAFSVFIFNSKNELLLQQRAEEKYHSPLLWSNTCCSHPLHNEDMGQTIERRLKEEMGLQCNTRFVHRFLYKVNFENGLTEHELDHVFFGKSDEYPAPNPAEVRDWKYITLSDLNREIDANPERYSAWLKICMPDVIRHFERTL